MATLADAAAGETMAMSAWECRRVWIARADHKAARGVIPWAGMYAVVWFRDAALGDTFVRTIAAETRHADEDVFIEVAAGTPAPPEGDVPWYCPVSLGYLSGDPADVVRYLSEVAERVSVL